MLAYSLFDMYCNDMLPKGPHGKTIEDIQALIDKYKDMDRRTILYKVMKELINYKQALA